MPVELWAASPSALITSLAVRCLVYSRVVGASARQALGGVVAFSSLWLVIATASIRATLGGSAGWARTPKFASTRSLRRAVRSAATETTLSIVLAGLALVVLALLPLGGITTMLGIAIMLKAVGLAASPLTALTADAGLHPRVAMHRPTAVETADAAAA